MISSPQGDVKHTGHIGLDGAYFGDVSFLDVTGNPPRQVVTPYKPSEDLEQQPLINPNSPSHLTGASSTSLPYPLLRQDNNPGDQPVILSTNIGTQLTNDAVQLRPNKKMGLNLAKPSKNKSKSLSMKRNKPNFPLGVLPNTDDVHEYHEISDNNADAYGENVGGGDTFAVPESPTTPKSQTDFSQSLLDEIDTMFRNLDSQNDQPMMRQYLEDNRAHTLNKIEKKKALRTGTMKPMSAQEQKTLDTAVALANEITTRSMNDLGKESMKLPTSPSDNKTKFNFKLPSRSNPQPIEIEKYSQVIQERRNFSDEAKRVRDIQATLTKESKFAYTSLIEQPTITTSFITQMAKGYAVMSKPSINYPKPPPKPVNCDQAGIVTPCVRPSANDDKSVQLDTDSEKETNIIPLPPRNTKPKLVDKPRHFRKYPLILPETADDQVQIHLKPAETGAMRKIPSNSHNNIYHNFSCFQKKTSVQNVVKDTVKEKVQYLNLTEDTDLNLVKDKEEVQETKATANRNSIEVAVTVHENKPKAETLVKDSTDHVSVEDLLEFADQKPCGRQRGVESDEVRIMCKVLKHEATPDNCLEALELSDWNVHQAIKTMRVKISIGDKTNLEECYRELSTCNGDVLKTLSILMLKYPKNA